MPSGSACAGSSIPGEVKNATVGSEVSPRRRVLPRETVRLLSGLFCPRERRGQGRYVDVIGDPRAGRPLGYVTANTESDEITELALSDASDLKRVLKGFLAFSRKDLVTGRLPEYETALNRTLARFAEKTWIEPADMYSIVDFATVIQAYLELRRTAGSLNPGTFSALPAGQAVTATVDDSGVSVVRRALPGAVELDRRQVQTLLLSACCRYEDTVSTVGWFPLPVFRYYADRF